MFLGSNFCCSSNDKLNAAKIEILPAGITCLGSFLGAAGCSLTVGCKLVLILVLGFSSILGLNVAYLFKNILLSKVEILW